MEICRCRHCKASCLWGAPRGRSPGMGAGLWSTPVSDRAAPRRASTKVGPWNSGAGSAVGAAVRAGSGSNSTVKSKRSVRPVWSTMGRSNLPIPGSASASRAIVMLRDPPLAMCLALMFIMTTSQTGGKGSPVGGDRVVCCRSGRAGDTSECGRSLARSYPALRGRGRARRRRRFTKWAANLNRSASRDCTIRRI